MIFDKNDLIARREEICFYLQTEWSVIKEWHKKHKLPINLNPVMASKRALDGWLADKQNKKRYDLIRRASCQVYFVQADMKDGLIKIGFAEVVSKRMTTLKNGSPIKLKLLATIPGTKHLERHYHSMFSKYRKHGEWFEASYELLDFIYKLKTNQITPK